MGLPRLRGELKASGNSRQALAGQRRAIAQRAVLALPVGEDFQILKILPTYYVAEGVSNALLKLPCFSSNVVDVSVTLGCAPVMFVGTVWLLRCRAEVAASI